MIYVTLFFLIIKITICSHVGSCLFYNRLTHGLQHECWSEHDLAQLRARRIFENVIPTNSVPIKLDSHYSKNILRYFRKALRLVNSDHDRRSSSILKEALADTIGAHLRSEILPAARFSYYAGILPYRNVRELHDYYDNIKLFLNTQGLGWKKPERIPAWNNLTVEKIQIGSGKFFDPCIFLVNKRDTNSCVHLPPPKMDDRRAPTAIALPFKNNGLFSLTSPKSENVLLKYYTTASRCLLKRSPETCRHTDFVTFNYEMWHWMKRDVAPHLSDEKLYPAFGGILRIAAATQDYAKGHTRRNLFAYQSAGVSKWHPWSSLKQSYVYINADWTPYCCVFIILVIGIAICLIQILYSYIFGDDDGCHCKGRPPSSTSTKNIAYANVESSIPAMLPPHKSIYYTLEHGKRTSTSSKLRTSSMSSSKTQKVYDLNENKEKFMDIILSESSDSSVDSDEVKNGESENNVIDVGCVDRGKSPPKIETSVDEVKILRRSARHPQMFSTTTTGATTQGQVTESLWSGSESSSSEQSVSTDSSKSRCRRSRSSRDLAWARRVISKHSLHGKSTSFTEVDCNSFTTPPSRR